MQKSEIQQFRISQKQKQTLSILRSKYNINTSQFIRAAINEKLQREKETILKFKNILTKWTSVHFKNKSIMKRKFDGKTYVLTTGGCNKCDLRKYKGCWDNCIDGMCWKRDRKPIKEIVIVLALLSLIGIGFYFLHKSAYPQPSKPKTTLSDSLEELKRLDDLYLEKLVTMENNDSIKLVGDLYEINCMKIQEMEGKR